MAYASSSSSKQPKRTDRSPESFESLRLRIEAAEILQSYERLSWHSAHRHESLQQTRLHFQNIVAGFTAADEAALVDWPIDNTPTTARNGDKASGSSSKGKDRLSNVSEQAAGDSKGKDRASTSGQSSNPGSAKKKRKSPAHG